jgi:hypothetical protein
MRAWLTKKLGITPQLIQYSKNAAARAEKKAQDLPFYVNDRLVLILLPREKYFDWQDQWHANVKTRIEYENHEKRCWDNSRAFLIPYMESDQAVEEFITKHRGYFLNSFVDSHSPKSRWPWAPSIDEFHEWFEYRLIERGPWDMSKDPLSKSPDLLTAIGTEL